MAESIIQSDRCCWYCVKTIGLERHHVFGGTANRRISEKYGLTVYLCHDCHTGKNGAQYDKEKNRELKAEAQKAFEKRFSRSLWMQIIRKNYL